MKVCCICGKKLNIISGSSIVEFNNKKYEMCGDCTGYRIRLNNSDLEIVNNSKNFFKNMIMSGNIQEDVLELLKSYIDKAEEKNNIYTEKIEKKRVYEKYYNSIKLTSGYNFEGYRISEYYDVLSTSVVIGTGMVSELSASISDFLGKESEKFSYKMDCAKESARDKLVRRVIEEGGNAVIGVNYDMFSLGQNMIAVSASGTAVKIESIEEIFNNKEN